VLLVISHVARKPKKDTERKTFHFIYYNARSFHLALFCNLNFTSNYSSIFFNNLYNALTHTHTRTYMRLGERQKFLFLFLTFNGIQWKINLWRFRIVSIKTMLPRFKVPTFFFKILFYLILFYKNQKLLKLTAFASRDSKINFEKASIIQW
jgi:hypothetical protein